MQVGGASIGMPASFVDIQAARVDGALLPSGRPTAERVHAAVLRVLDESSLCSWSTVTSDRKAHVNIGYFARSDEVNLYLLSHPGSQHSRNIAVNPSMGVAVFASGQNWTDPGRGIQLFGIGMQVADADVPSAERLYGERY